MIVHILYLSALGVLQVVLGTTEGGRKYKSLGRVNYSENSFRCFSEGFHADARNCRTFYRCVDWTSNDYFRDHSEPQLTAFRFECGEGTVFDPDYNICNHPWDTRRAECGGQRGQGQGGYPGQGSEEQGYPDQGSYPSNGGYPGQVQGAYPGQGGNQKPGGYPGEEMYLNEKENQIMPSKEGETNQNPLGSSEKCSSPGFHPVKGDCQKFVRCVDNGNGGYTKYEFSCGPGTVWDPANNVCNYPNQVPGCGELGGSSNPRPGGSPEQGGFPGAGGSATASEQGGYPKPHPGQGEYPRPQPGQGGYPASGGSSGTSGQDGYPRPQPGQGGYPAPGGSPGTSGQGGYPGPGGSPGAPGQGGYPRPQPGQGGYPAPGGSPDTSGQGGYPGVGGSPGAPGQGGYPRPQPGQGEYPRPQPGQGGYPGKQPGQGNAPGQGGYPRPHPGQSGSAGTGGYPGSGGSPGEVGYPRPGDGQGSYPGSGQRPGSSGMPEGKPGQTYPSSGGMPSQGGRPGESGYPEQQPGGESPENGSSPDSEGSTPGHIFPGKCNAPGFYGVPGNCKKFIRCVDNGNGDFMKYEFECGAGTAWDIKLNTCNHASMVQGCEKEMLSMGSGQTGYPESGEMPGQGEYPNQPTPGGLPGQQPGQGGYPGQQPGQGGYPGQQPGQGYPSPGQRPGQGGYPGQQPGQGYPSPGQRPGQGGYPGQQPGQGYPSPGQEGYPQSGGIPEEGGSPYNPDNNNSNPEEINPPPGDPSECQNDGFYQVQNNCKAFYRCVNNGKDGFLRYDFQCGEGTVWDQENQVCNYPWAVARGNVNCGTSSTNQTFTQTTSSSSSSTTSQTSSYYNTTSTSQSQFTTSSTTSQTGSSQTQTQTGTMTGSQTTGQGSNQFSSTKPDESGSTKPMTPEPKPTTENPKPETSSPGEDPSKPPPGSLPCDKNKDQSQIKCEKDGFYPDPSDCSKFYRCADWGDNKFSVYYFECGKGTIWDPALQTCNHEKSVYPPRDCSMPNKENEQKPSSQSTPSPATGEPNNASTAKEPSLSTAAATTSTRRPSTSQPTTTPSKVTTTGPETSTPGKGSQSTTTPTSQPTDVTDGSTSNTDQTESPSSSTDSSMETTESTSMTGSTPASTDFMESTASIPPSTPSSTDSTESTTSVPPSTSSSTDTTDSTTSMMPSTPSNTDSTESTTSVPSSPPPTTDSTESTTSVPSSPSPSTDSTESSTRPESTEMTSNPTDSTTISQTEPSSSESTEPTESTTTQITTQSPGGRDPNCPELNDNQSAFVCPTGFRRHPKDCNLFYQCTTSKDTGDINVMVLSCKNDTVYDERKIQCLPPDQTDSCQNKGPGRRVYRKIEDEFISVVYVPPFKRLCPEEGSFPYEGDCKRFYKCKKDKRGKIQGYLYQCPEDYSFNGTTGRCEKTSKLPHCTRSIPEMTSKSMKWMKSKVPFEYINVAFR